MKVVYDAEGKPSRLIWIWFIWFNSLNIYFIKIFNFWLLQYLIGKEAKLIAMVFWTFFNN